MRTFLPGRGGTRAGVPARRAERRPRRISTATESKRSHRVVVGLLMGVTGGALAGLHFGCEAGWVASPHVPLDEQDPCADGGIGVGKATLIGAALGALVGLAVDVEATGRAELRVGSGPDTGSQVCCRDPSADAMSDSTLNPERLHQMVAGLRFGHHANSPEAI